MGFGVQDTSIKADRVTHIFPGGMSALRDVTLHVQSGEFVAVVGPSGCGKTTLLNLIAGLIELHDGHISVADAPPKAGRRDVAYMLARDSLLPWRTALGNVMLGGEFRRVPKALSHGMRPRVALARSFTLESPILLMDEPFG